MCGAAHRVSATGRFACGRVDLAIRSDVITRTWSRSLAPNSPIRVGVIGFGFVSKTFHVPLLKGTDGYRIAAVSSSHPADVKSVIPDVDVVSDPKAGWLDDT